jgi:hypothetical protein
MVKVKLPRRRGSQKTSKPVNQALLGQTAAAAKNREYEVRFEIVKAYSRLNIPYQQWPACVQEFYTNPGQRIEYHQFIAPSPFQPPRFDRLKQSPEQWAKLADRKWEQHRNRFLKACESWVAAGVDEEIAEETVRGSGKRPHSRKRGQNTPLDKRYEWAALYLQGVPLKIIADPGTDVSTVGRVARAVIRSAGWPLKSRKSKPSAGTVAIHQEFPKAKYHPTKPARIVQDSAAEALLGDDWTDRPSAKDVE